MKSKKYFTKKEIIKECDISRDILRGVGKLLKNSHYLEYNSRQIKKNKSGENLYSEALYELIKDYRYIKGEVVSKELKLGLYDMYFEIKRGLIEEKHTKSDTDAISRILRHDARTLKSLMRDSNLVFVIETTKGRIRGFIQSSNYSFEDLRQKFKKLFPIGHYNWLIEDSIDTYLGNEFYNLIAGDLLHLNQNQFLETFEGFVIRTQLPKSVFRPDFIGKNGKVSTPELMLLKLRDITSKITR